MGYPERINHLLPIAQIRPNPHNARNHPRAPIRKLAQTIKSIGFGQPLLVDENKALIAGHGRLEAVQLLGWETVPVVELRGLSEAQKRALALADNKIFESGGWKREQLAIELAELPELLTEEGLDVSVTGFDAVEIDQLQVDFEEDSS